MASPSDTWMREFKEASKLADEVSSMISEKNALPSSGPGTQRHLSSCRRKCAILKNRLETLQSRLSKPPASANKPSTTKEMNRLQDMLSHLSSEASEMSNTLNMSFLGDRYFLFGSDKKPDQVMKTVNGLDNHEIIEFQRQIIKEQDEGLEKLEGMVTTTQHIALAIHEELSLHTRRLLETIDLHVDSTDSHLALVQKQVAILNKHTKGCSSSLTLMVVVMVFLIFVVLGLLKYL